MVTLAVAGLAAGLSGCASSPTTTPSATTPSATASSAGGTSAVSSSATSAVSSAAPASGTAGSGPAGVGGTTTLTGTIAAGVESGCLILTDKTGAVLANLQGVDPTSVALETEVDVTGKFETDVMTTCMQGKPFAVTSIQPKQ